MPTSEASSRVPGGGVSSESPQPLDCPGLGLGFIGVYRGL